MHKLSIYVQFYFWLFKFQSSFKVAYIVKWSKIDLNCRFVEVRRKDGDHIKPSLKDYKRQETKKVDKARKEFIEEIFRLLVM